jgi:hypothetical protein
MKDKHDDTKQQQMVTSHQARSQQRDKRLSASSRLSVRPSDHIEQLGSHWTDLHKISYFDYFSNCRQNSSFINPLTLNNL